MARLAASPAALRARRLRLPPPIVRYSFGTSVVMLFTICIGGLVAYRWSISGCGVGQWLDFKADEIQTIAIRVVESCKGALE